MQSRNSVRRLLRDILESAGVKDPARAQIISRLAKPIFLVVSVLSILALVLFFFPALRNYIPLTADNPRSGLDIATASATTYIASTSLPANIVYVDPLDEKSNPCPKTGSSIHGGAVISLFGDAITYSGPADHQPCLDRVQVQAASTAVNLQIR
jgi:hypothetical protein